MAVSRFEVKAMKSNKQRRLEIKAKRRKRAEKAKQPDHFFLFCRPADSIASDQSQLTHNGRYWAYPSFYVDELFTCRRCGKQEIWTAKSQKWWYEEAKGNINSVAVHCKKCRSKNRHEKEQQKQHMELMAQRKPHPNESFFKKRY